MCALTIQQLSKQYSAKGNPAIRHFSLTIGEGEFLALVGASGCGKSTLLRLIAGLEYADHGSISISGREVSSASRHLPPEKRGVGMVFQDYALFPHLTVRENICFGISAQPAEARQKRTAEMLELIRLPEFADRYPHSLSGGEQQRIALARSLAPSPSLLLLDEPFSNLDESLKAELRLDIRRIVESTGTTTILVTHDMNDALSIADRIAILRHGELQQLDTPEGIYRRPATPYVAAFFGDVNLLPADSEKNGFRTAFGFIPAETGDAPSRCLLGLRPGDIQLIEEDSSGRGLRGIAGQTAFMGDVRSLEVYPEEGAGSKTLKVHLPGNDQPAPGQEVILLPRPGRLLIFDAIPALGT